MHLRLLPWLHQPNAGRNGSRRGLLSLAERQPPLQAPFSAKAATCAGRLPHLVRSLLAITRSCVLSSEVPSTCHCLLLCCKKTLALTFSLPLAFHLLACRCAARADVHMVQQRRVPHAGLRLLPPVLLLQVLPAAPRPGHQQLEQGR